MNLWLILFAFLETFPLTGHFISATVLIVIAMTETLPHSVLLSFQGVSSFFL